jgi:hypothetical protein
LLTVAFWNVRKKPDVLSHLSCLAKNLGVDVFLLAEAPHDLTPALPALNGLGAGAYAEADNAGCKVRALTRLPPPEFVHRLTGIAGDVAVWSVRAPAMTPVPEVLLAGVHLPSKFGGMSEASQAVVACEVVREINELEDARNHRNTAVVGDFNMHPYDEGMTSAAAFHGLMTARLAGLPDREYRGRPCRRLYNPMWGLLGDRTPGPAGTYRWASSVPHNTHWGMLDQVLLRKDLIGRLTGLEILGSDGVHNLLGVDDFPDPDHFSDHLPVLLRLDV